MATITLTSRAFFTGIAAVVILEAAFHRLGFESGSTGAWALVGLRLLEFTSILVLVKLLGHGLKTFGIARATLGRDIFRGSVWCVSFALCALMGMGGLQLAGINPLMLFSDPIPSDPWHAAAYLAGAGCIGPLAEELFFRGLIFGFLRHWGAWVAIIGSTAFFALCHFTGSNIPATQIVGGLVFALAYEREKSLMAPLMIHMSGNLAIAGLGYLGAG